MPDLAERYWTAADVRALPDDGNRYECISGELLVTPAPRLPHQAALFAIARALDTYVSAHRLGTFLWSPADIELIPGDLVQPDIFVARPKPGVKKLRSWSEIAGLVLAIEILSPSTARYDRGVKRAYYQRAGVGEYWIVDLDARLIERWRSADVRPEILRNKLVWAPEGATAPLELDLTTLFADILDE